jgi:hypothetical protein
MPHHDSQSCFSQRLNQRKSTSATADFFNKIGPGRRLLRDSITSEFEGKAYQDWHNNEYKREATAAVITGPVEGTTTESAKAAE